MTPTRPRVLVLAFSTLRSDARVLRQISLLNRDYDVATVGYGAAPAGAVSHLRIPDDIVAWRRRRVWLILRRYQRAYDSAPIIRFLRPRLAGGRWDAVVANDVEAVPLAVGLDSDGVHADLHEYAPRQNEETWRWRWFVAPFNAWVVRRWVSQAASVSTVGPELAREYLKEFGISASVVVNAAAYADRSPTPVAEPLRLVHSGLARRNRSLEVMIDAVRQARRDLTLDLYLMPNDPAYLAELKEAAADLVQVRFRAPVTPGELGERLAENDLGIFVLPPVTFNYLHTLPNKFFDYVQARLGIIVGPTPEMASLVQEHGLGVVLPDFAAPSLARALEDLSPEQIAGFKTAADAVAQDLGAESQLHGWSTAIRDIVVSGNGAGETPA